MVDGLGCAFADNFSALRHDGNVNVSAVRSVGFKFKKGVRPNFGKAVLFALIPDVVAASNFEFANVDAVIFFKISDVSGNFDQNVFFVSVGNVSHSAEFEKFVFNRF